jgi:putative hemolysin
MLHQTKRIEDEEKNLIEGVFTFGDTKVEEIMTPRTDIIYLEKQKTIEDMLKLINETGYSRFPIIEDSLDDIKGIIHIRDIVKNMTENNRGLKIFNFIKQALFVPETKMADSLLKEFQYLNLHMAIIVNEYGGTAGLVTLEDLVEEIVGDIKDEYDKEKGYIKKIDKSHVTLRGNTDIGDINQKINIHIPDTEEYETIAGFILHKLNHIPDSRENIKYFGWNIIVTDMDKNRINRVKLVKHEEDDI